MQKIGASRDLLEKFAASHGQTLPDPLPPPLPYTSSPGETVCDRCHGIRSGRFSRLRSDPRAARASVPERAVGECRAGSHQRRDAPDCHRPDQSKAPLRGRRQRRDRRLDDIDAYPDTAWRPLTDSQPTLRFRTMAVAPSRSRVLYAANALKELTPPSNNVYSEICRSGNRGLTWQPVHDPGMGVVHRLLVHPANPDVVFAATSTGFWRRSSHPGAWARLFAGDCLDAGLDPEDSSILYLGVRNVGVFKSFTSGAVWSVDPIVAFDAASSGGREVIKIALGRRNTDGSAQSPTARTIAVRFGNELCVNHQSGDGGAAAWQRTVPVVMVPNTDPPPAEKDDTPKLLGRREYPPLGYRSAAWQRVVQLPRGRPLRPTAHRHGLGFADGEG